MNIALLALVGTFLPGIPVATFSLDRFVGTLTPDFPTAAFLPGSPVATFSPSSPAAALSPGNSPVVSPAVAVEIDHERIKFLRSGRLVTEYRYAGNVPTEPGGKPQPLAKPFFYPLLAPNGLAVTRDWPLKAAPPGGTTDHVHQRSAWFCHGDVAVHGLDLKSRTHDRNVAGIDFWSEQSGHGRIVCLRVDQAVPDSDGVYIETVNEWRSADGIAVLNEQRRLSVRALPQGTLIALRIRLTPTAWDVTFADTKEGALGVRVRDEFRLNATGSRGVVTSASGEEAKPPAKDTLPLWGQIANWQDYSGEAEGQTAGVALFAHPDNSLATAWHTRAYGLMAANPFARQRSGFPALAGRNDPVRLGIGEELTLKYALYVHDGDAAAGRVDAAFAAYSRSDQ